MSRWVRHGALELAAAAASASRIGALERDLADLRQENLQLHRRNATAIDDARGQMANLSGCVHDARGRLTNLSGFTQLLVQREGSRMDETSQRYLAHLLRAVGDMRGLFDRLLDEARAPLSSLVALADVVADVAAMLDPAIERAGAHLVVETLPIVPGDPRELERLFANLIGNALKHGHPDRPLTVTISAMGTTGGWDVAVNDNGTGIPAAAQHRIFDLFEQAAPAGPGSGIGLAVCRTVAQDHGGHIRVEKRPGHGTRFVVFLPELRMERSPLESLERRGG